MSAQLSINFTSPKMPREGTDNWRVLRMLECGPCTTTHFYDARLGSFRSRISNLRDMGWNIPDGERVREGVWVYRLVR